MTLIATAISKHGLVHAAVAGLTSYPKHQTNGKRVFRLGFLNAAMTVTGGYVVDGREPLDEWIPTALEQYAQTAEAPTVGGFAEYLTERLTPQPNPLHRRMIHIAGYVEDNNVSHPVHYFVRNVLTTKRDGSYGRAGRSFFVSEEYWTRDHRNPDIRNAIAAGGAHVYLNGFPDCRISYLALHQRMHDLYQRMWSASRHFHPPRSLEDLAAFLALDLRGTVAFLGTGKRDGQAMDGMTVEVDSIPAPARAVAFS
jgi:hypothetical protein